VPIFFSRFKNTCSLHLALHFVMQNGLKFSHALQAHFRSLILRHTSV